MKKSKKIIVEKGLFVWMKNGAYKIRCTMSDNSIWECNQEYKNWKCVKPSDELLTEHFEKFISEGNGEQ